MVALQNSQKSITFVKLFTLSFINYIYVKFNNNIVIFLVCVRCSHPVFQDQTLKIQTLSYKYELRQEITMSNHLLGFIQLKR